MCGWLSRGFRVASGRGYASCGLVWDWLRPEPGLVTNTVQDPPKERKEVGEKKSAARHVGVMSPCSTVQFEDRREVPIPPPLLDDSFFEKGRRLPIHVAGCLLPFLAKSKGNPLPILVGAVSELRGEARLTLSVGKGRAPMSRSQSHKSNSGKSRGFEQSNHMCALEVPPGYDCDTVGRVNVWKSKAVSAPPFQCRPQWRTPAPQNNRGQPLAVQFAKYLAASSRGLQANQRSPDFFLWGQQFERKPQSNSGNGSLKLQQPTSVGPNKSAPTSTGRSGYVFLRGS